MFLLFHFTDSYPQCSTSWWGRGWLRSAPYQVSLDCNDFGSACQCDSHIRILLFTGITLNLKLFLYKLYKILFQRLLPQGTRLF